MTAVYDGDVKSTEQLLRARADVNVVMRIRGGKRTPIYYAVRHGHHEILRLLLQQDGIDINRKMQSCKGTWTTPLEAAQDAGPGSPIYRVFAEQGLLPQKDAAVVVVAGGLRLFARTDL